MAEMMEKETQVPVQDSPASVPPAIPVGKGPVVANIAGKKKRRRMIRRIVLLLIIAAAAFFGWKHFGGGDAAEGTGEVVVDTVQYGSITAIVENSGLFKREADQLVEYLDRVPDTTIIIFAESQMDKRSKLYKKINTVGYAAEMGRQSEKELQMWILRFLWASSDLPQYCPLRLAKAGSACPPPRVSRTAFPSRTESPAFAIPGKISSSGNWRCFWSMPLPNRSFPLWRIPILQDCLPWWIPPATPFPPWTPSAG